MPHRDVPRSLTYPNVKREPAVLKGPRSARHRQDLVDRVSGEEYNRVVVWIDEMNPSAAIINNQIATLELPGMLMKVIDAGQPSLPVRTARIYIAVLPKK